MGNSDRNFDLATVASFGDEWTRFDQCALSDREAHRIIFDEYFAIFPWDRLPENPVGFDMGCGSGRWAKLVVPRVSHLHCIDPSLALEVARRMLAGRPMYRFIALLSAKIRWRRKVRFWLFSGRLHHVPDRVGAISACVRMLKPEASFLLYLYYAFEIDLRSSDCLAVFRSTPPRNISISCNPEAFAHGLFGLVAYYPLARFALIAKHLGLAVESIPLSAYRNRSF